MRNLEFSNKQMDSPVFFLGYSMDAKSYWVDCSQRFYWMERKVRCQRSTILLFAQPMCPNHERIAWRNIAIAHLHGMPQQLSLDSWSYWRWILLQIILILSAPIYSSFFSTLFHFKKNTPPNIMKKNTHRSSCGWEFLKNKTTQQQFIDDGQKNQSMAFLAALGFIS